MYIQTNMCRNKAMIISNESEENLKLINICVCYLMSRIVSAWNVSYPLFTHLSPSFTRYLLDLYSNNGSTVSDISKYLMYLFL